MIKQNLQNMLESRNFAPCDPCAQRRAYNGSVENWFVRTIHTLRQRLAESKRKAICEAEISQAIEHLQALTDEQLRDVGITRLDIAHAVRFGKNHNQEGEKV